MSALCYLAFKFTFCCIFVAKCFPWGGRAMESSLAPGWRSAWPTGAVISRRSGLDCCRIGSLSPKLLTFELFGLEALSHVVFGLKALSHVVFGFKALYRVVFGLNTYCLASKHFSRSVWLKGTLSRSVWLRGTFSRSVWLKGTFSGRVWLKHVPFGLKALLTYFLT
jgi:hypothetical protein